jgi:hypothetical protein
MKHTKKVVSGFLSFALSYFKIILSTDVIVKLCDVKTSTVMANKKIFNVFVEKQTES